MCPSYSVKNSPQEAIVNEATVSQNSENVTGLDVIGSELE